MADPEHDHGFVFYDDGEVDILASPFFDVHFGGAEYGGDATAEEYLERIIYQLVLNIERQLPPGDWYHYGRILPARPVEPRVVITPTDYLLGGLCLLVALLGVAFILLR